MTYEQESQLRQVILRFVQAVADRGVSLPKIKLVKLLYLVDLEAFKRRGAPAMGLDWQFHHYGPYARALEPVFERAEGSYFERVELQRQQATRWAVLAGQLGGSSVPLENEVVFLYKPLYGLADEPINDDWLSGIVDRVSEKWAGEDTETILKHVYATGPIAQGERYQPLDWNLAPREPGLYGNLARHFILSDAVRASIERTWASWEETGRDRWSPYEPEPGMFDDVWVAALAWMDEDEGAPVTQQFRIRGALPQGQSADD